MSPAKFVTIVMNIRLLFYNRLLFKYHAMNILIETRTFFLALLMRIETVTYE
jgi:hypothetical protein